TSSFRDLRLLRVRDVHNHAAFEHFRQADFHAPLIRSLASVAASIYLLRVHVTSPLNSWNSRRYFSVKTFSAFFTSARLPQIAPCPSPGPRRPYRESRRS